MFYINYIKFKDPQQNKQVALLISLTLLGLLIYISKGTLLNFITGKSIQVYEYTYILLLIYLVVNVYIAVNLDSEPTESVSNSQKKIEVEKAIIKDKTKPLEIVDDFIFPQKISYNFKNERDSLVPTFSDHGLTPPDIEENEVSFEPPSMLFPEDLVFNIPETITPLEEEERPLTIDDLNMQEDVKEVEKEEVKELEHEEEIEHKHEPLDEFDEIALKRKMFKEQLLNPKNQSDKLI